MLPRGLAAREQQTALSCSITAAAEIPTRAVAVTHRTRTRIAHISHHRIRLGWHSSGSYDPAAAVKGGSNAAGMRLAPERDDPENTGLDVARALLAPLKEAHPKVSYADLWILAAYCALEHTGGPVIDFAGGRADAEVSVEPGRLPQAEFGLDPDLDSLDAEGRPQGWPKLAQHLRDVFGRMVSSEQAQRVTEPPLYHARIMLVSCSYHRVCDACADAWRMVRSAGRRIQRARGVEPASSDGLWSTRRVFGRRR